MHSTINFIAPKIQHNGEKITLYVRDWIVFALMDSHIEVLSTIDFPVWCLFTSGQRQLGKVHSTSGEDARVMILDGKVLTMPKGTILPANPNILKDTDDLVQLSFLNELSVLHNLFYGYSQRKSYIYKIIARCCRISVSHKTVINPCAVHRTLRRRCEVDSLRRSSNFPAAALRLLIAALSLYLIEFRAANMGVQEYGTWKNLDFIIRVSEHALRRKYSV
ncbi:hypothetical protein Syun_003342 [Stephania yunnanensis]|uniref:Myosin-1-3 N-terminal SH3 domain-containing protein n=1 Tax=Stephania yunnanensis TaxID=152371 RepID=A0AAP0L212_9MAGN